MNPADGSLSRPIEFDLKSVLSSKDTTMRLHNICATAESISSQYDLLTNGWTISLRSRSQEMIARGG